MKRCCVIDAAVGLWLMLTAFLGFGPRGNFWNDLIVGFVVVAASYMMIRRNLWEGWITGLLGFWLMIAPFALEMKRIIGINWHNYVVGIAIAVTAFISMGSGKRLLH